MSDEYRINKLGFLATPSDEAEAARSALVKLHGEVLPHEADAIVAIGGDGLMLRSLHQFMNTGVPIYGMHLGTIGFLMNEYREEGLLQRINEAVETKIHPLFMQSTNVDGTLFEASAFNEVSLLRFSYQAAKLQIHVDGKVRMDTLICDGVLVATPAGSTAYNFSAHGPILPIDSNLLALTPISAFRPRRWRGALLSNEADISIRVHDAKQRPVSVVADNKEFHNIENVVIKEDRSSSSIMLFDPGHNLDDRILDEQFRY